jgi:hypothetical protein
MSDKLKGLSPVYYLNLDEEVERKIYMENQFDKWKISNVTRFSGSEYKPENFDDWKDLLHFPHFYTKQQVRHVCTALSTIKMLEYFLSTDEKYVILMEDDYDLDLIKYWHFDWEYLMNSIPYDFDSLQLGFASHLSMSFFLHIKTGHSYFGPMLITRHYAQKLVNLFYIKEKYLFMRKSWVYPHNCKYKFVSIDESFGRCGKVYQLPLITDNPDLDKIPKRSHYASRDLCYWWWQNERDKFSLDDFFSFGKPNDFEMTHPVDLLKWK